MERMSLDGDWELWHFLEGDREVGPEDLDKLGKPLRAQVPGNVELDLVRAGEIPDPFFGRNFFLLRELEFHEWWYRSRFTLPGGLIGRRCELVFEGLDTIATVWLNGRKVGESANMLVEQRFDVTGVLREGENELVVRLGSAVNWARRRPYEPLHLSWEEREEALWLRKPAHCFGWDIAPRIVSAGIWRPVYLAIYGPDEIEDVYYYTSEASEDTAVLGVWFKFGTEAPTLDGFSLRIRGVCPGSEFEGEFPVEFVSGHLKVEVPKSRLWRPKGYGDPNLYEVSLELLRDGRVVASRSDRIGLRTVRLEREERSGDKGRFRFVVNGIPLRLVGANWVPLDAFHSRDAGRVEQVVELFDDLGCQMIRCWGGGVYESDRFYELCDERGIMVWQDFAFACARYPQSEDFQEVVRDEVRKVVRRLRNHPSLVLWCGDNECDYAYDTVNAHPEDNVLTRRVIPEVVRRMDPYRPYLPSSPYISPENRRGVPMPEQHLWGPREYFKSKFYTEHMADFISEIGYHGCPNVSSLKRFLPEEDLWPWDNPSWRAHSVEHWRGRRRSYDRNELMLRQVREFFGKVPEDLESFVRASQFTQAEANKFFVEQARIKGLGGILWWNVMDCWPQISDALVDYYFGKKLAYRYIWRVQRPVCVMVGEPESWSVPVVVDNLTLKDAAGSFRVWDADTGEVLLEGEFRVPANRNRELGRIGVFRGEQRLFLISWEVGGERFGNHYLLGSPPFSLEKYEAWLRKIASLPRQFDPDEVGK